MTVRHHYDTVAFDVRDTTTMLFFARTGADADIEDYVLLMRSISEDFDEQLVIEINESQFGGPDLLREARLVGNSLALSLNERSPVLGDRDELVLSFAPTEDNLRAIESGAFRVFGDRLVGGNA